MTLLNNSSIKFLTILFVVFVSAAEIDICVPSFPQIQYEFVISPFQTECLLGANLLFHCIAALFAGNLGDKYGRKRVVNIGLGVFILSSLLCYFSVGYYSLLIGRILQGIGVAASIVLAPVIILDFYEKEKQQKVMSLFNGFGTLAICLAPTMGSFATLFFNWRFNFLLLVLLGSLALAVFHAFIPSDKKNNPHIGFSIREYAIIFKSKVTVLYITSLSLCIGAYYTFVGMASIIYVGSFGVSLKTFGIYQGLLTLAFGLTSIFSGSIMDRIGKKVSFLISIGLMILFLVACLLFVIFNVQHPNWITSVIILLSIGVVVPLNMMYVLALDSIAGASGKVSGLITTGKWLFSIFGIQTASYFYSHDFRSTGLLMLVMELGALVIIFVLLKKDDKYRENVYHTVACKEFI